MTWIQLPHNGPCETCGTEVEVWVILRCGRRKMAEASFCPTCYPDLAKVFAVPEKTRGVASERYT